MLNQSQSSRIRAIMGDVVISCGERELRISHRDFQKYGTRFDGLAEILLSTDRDRKRREYPEAFVNHPVGPDKHNNLNGGEHVCVYHGPGQFLRSLYPGQPGEPLFVSASGRRLIVRHAADNEVIDIHGEEEEYDVASDARGLFNLLRG